ncbi:MAG: hypothetical protein P4L00_11915 [Candidatus Acidoferrales bacterium]|nr:hypothetical protein [Candidatus Acidoferrales bacterium]
MRITRIPLAVAAVCCVLTFSAASAFGQAASDDQIVEQARKAYYNLHDEGLKEFRCEVRVDWDAASAGTKTDGAVRPEFLPPLDHTHFEAAVGAMGAPQVSLHFDGAPPNDEAAARIRTASAGVQRTLAGVLQELSSFLFGSPLPPDADYHLEAQGDRFRITFGSDEVRIVETMNKDRALEEMIVATQRSTVSVRPQFKRGEKGFLPVVIDSSVAAAGTDKVELHVEIAYQTHDGFELPQTVKVSDKQLAGGTPIQFSFSNYQVTR